MKLLALALVLALVAFGIVVVEVIPRLAADRAAGSPAAGGDELVLRFGEAPAAAIAPPAIEPDAIEPGAIEGVDYHVVRKGETLSAIAGQAYGDPSRAGELARLNGLLDPDTIEVGQRLRLR